MSDYVQSARANASGTATISIQHNKSGIIWVVSQISVNSNPVRPAANCTVTRNGQLMTTTAIVPATAGGQPYYQLASSDVLALSFTGLTSGDTAIATISYQESIWGEPNSGNVI